MNLLGGMPLYRIPDDDERFVGVPAGSVLTNGHKFLVREREYEALVEKLKQSTKPLPPCASFNPLIGR